MTWPAFTNPWMLGALVAVGVPVLIHFLTRARPRRVEFPPFRFLIEACAGQQSLHRLRTIILLTLRSLALAALVLMFARPYWNPAAASGGTEATRRVVLILDASLSMRAIVNGTTLFSSAQAGAAEVLRSLEPGSEAAVILSSRSAHPLLPALSRNLPALHDALVRALPTFEQGEPAVALALARQLLGNQPGTLHIFSDFQQTTWSQVQELPAGVACHLRPVVPQPVPNLALTSARLLPAEPVVGEAAQVVCTVLNATAQPRQETVRLELAALTQEARITVPPFASADAVFNLSFPTPGVVTGHAFLAPDDLREDDARYLAARVRKALSILVVSDSEATDARSGAFFVTRALVPSSQAAPGFQVIRRHGQDADRGILETAEVFVLVAPATLSGEAGEIISRRVQEGAPLLAFLDGPTAPNLVPAALRPPFQLLQTITSPGGDSLLAGPGRSFLDADASDWSTIHLHRHWLSPMLEGRSDELLLSYPDGSAALTLTPVGKGMVAFANLPLTPDGGDLIGHPLFPALVHELLRTLRRGAEDRIVTPGEAWTIDATPTSEEPLRALDPAGQPLEARTVSSGRLTRLALPTASTPGPYLIRQGETIAGAGVVNVDPRESDTRPVALTRLKPGPGTSVTVATHDEDLLLAGRTRPLWPHLAAATLLFLAAEMTLLALWRRPTTR